MAATSVKFAMPPPISRALLRPSGSAVAHCNTVMIREHNLHKLCSDKANRYDQLEKFKPQERKRIYQLDM